MRVVYLSLFLSCLLCACSASRPVASLAQPAVESSADQQPRILTLLLKATWNSDSSVQFELFNDIRNQGRLKPGQGHTLPAQFIAYFCTEQGQVLDSCLFTDPLTDRVEAENEQGRLQTTIYHKQEGYTDIRVNYQPAMKQLRIQPVLRQTKPQRPQTINLK